VAIRLGIGPWPGLAATRLITPALFPVCTPALARRLRKPVDLAYVTWLGSSHLPESWNEWTATVGYPDLGPPRVQNFDNLQLLYEAATGGLGVALGIEPIVAPYLSDGRLVAPFPERVRRSRAYWLVCRRAETNRPAIRAFRRWAVSEARS
jgi:LysR family transcriptional regulator, glycine cleavage system transcriptional activator